MKQMRGHHLLCVHGFRGMGYSQDFIQMMTEIVKDIRDNQKDFTIRVVVGFDEACFSCPNKGENICEASPTSQEHVTTLDQNVIRHLELEVNGVYHKSDLMKRTVERVNPEDLDFLCKGCSWLSTGVCKEGIRQLKQSSERL
ncbi:DUF1284 domain-containing protein [Bacillus sp. REN10]|uniref:DUF1284 domain-containing protein n=1 Tax=Bacillus sp. REN10 TaxID=2782541 RepID=UPI00193C4E31|nr:DUF1284 domain-containing protein [Bacillus sp. REN10]